MVDWQRRSLQQRAEGGMWLWWAEEGLDIELPISPFRVLLPWRGIWAEGPDVLHRTSRDSPLKALLPDHTRPAVEANRVRVGLSCQVLSAMLYSSIQQPHVTAYSLTGNFAVRCMFYASHRSMKHVPMASRGFNIQWAQRIEKEVGLNGSVQSSVCWGLEIAFGNSAASALACETYTMHFLFS